jgi:geranylgeranyl pyrophosphate synthase
MIDGKTGAMFKMLARMMKSMSPSQNWPVADLDKLTELFGRWYQVRDDYQNLHDPVYAEQKGFCEDLDEGKLSYPVVLCCISDPGARVIILDVFRRNRKGTVLALDVKMQILDLIRKSGALDETWQVIQQLRKEVEDTISILETDIGEPSPSLRLIIKLLGNIRPP